MTSVTGTANCPVCADVIFVAMRLTTDAPSGRAWSGSFTPSCGHELTREQQTAVFKQAMADLPPLPQTKEPMRIHNDLNTLLPSDVQDMLRRGYHTRFSAEELTAFAAAVAGWVVDQWYDHDPEHDFDVVMRNRIKQWSQRASTT